MRNLRWLFFVLILMPLTASALRGEWESSGDMPMAYIPEYGYEYSCQIEITDFLERTYQGQAVQVFAVGRVTLTNDQRFVTSDEITWNTFLLGANEDIELQGFRTFPIKETWIGLDFDKGTPDKVYLRGKLALPIGEFVVEPDAQEQEGTRDDASLSIKAYISGGSYDSRSMFAVCDKVK